MYNYIGIDVSKQELSLFNGKELLSIKNERGLKGLNTYLGKNLSDTVLIFEATGVYSGYLQEYCRKRKIKTYIINPKRSSNFVKVMGHRSKTDETDAKALYAFKEIIKEQEIKLLSGDKIAKELKTYITGYEFIQKSITSVTNQIEALKYNINAPKVLLSMMKREQKRLKKLKEELLTEMRSYIRNNEELRKDYENIKSIKGIGEISAIALLSIFRQYENSNRAEITALLGLDVIKRESGTSVRGKSRINKSGNGNVRKILYFPTMCAIQYNKKISKFYNRLVENHKPKKVALMAAMRKLVLIAHAIYKNKEPYRTIRLCLTFITVSEFISGSRGY